MNHTHFSMPYHLRAKRNAVLFKARYEDRDNAEIILAHNKSILGPVFPLWADRDVFDEHCEALQWQRDFNKEYRETVKEMKSLGLEEEFESLWKETLKILTIRIRPDSQDALKFYQDATDKLCSFNLCSVGEDKWQDMLIPFIPHPHDKIVDIEDVPVFDEEDYATIGEILYTLEEGAIAHLLRSEMLVICQKRKGRIPADASHPFFDLVWQAAWHRITKDSLAGPGTWMESFKQKDITSIIATYGQGGESRNIIFMARETQKLLDDIDRIGGQRIIALYSDPGHEAHYIINPNGSFKGENEQYPWVEASFRSLLAVCLGMGGSIILDRVSNSKNALTNEPIMETFSVGFHELKSHWLTPAQCRSVFFYDYETGKPLPRKESRIYRGYDTQTKSIIKD